MFNSVLKKIFRVDNKQLNINKGRLLIKSPLCFYLYFLMFSTLIELSMSSIAVPESAKTASHILG